MLIVRARCPNVGLESVRWSFKSGNRTFDIKSQAGCRRHINSEFAASGWNLDDLYTTSSLEKSVRLVLRHCVVFLMGFLSM